MELVLVFVSVPMIIGLLFLDSGQCKDSDTRKINDISGIIKQVPTKPLDPTMIFHDDGPLYNLHNIDMKQFEGLNNNIPLPYTNLYDVSRNNYYIEDSIPSSKNIPVPMIWSGGQWPYAEQLGIPVAVNPFVHPLYPTLPTSRISSLPPVQTTHFHNMLPWERTNPRYDIDMNEAERMLLPSERIARSSGEDFMAELQHDAMMNNILPTMPFPFYRESQATYTSLPPSRMGTNPVMAVFPPGMTNDCAIPLLLGCSPKITRGTLENNIYQNHYYLDKYYENQNGWTNEGKEIAEKDIDTHPNKHD